VIARNAREPQSEAEESKEKPSFERALAKEARTFVMGIENFQVINRADLKGLKAMLDSNKIYIASLGRFKDSCGVTFLSLITQLD